TNMRIKRLSITNYRAIRDSTLDFSEATALIGENNSGKSTFLLALDLFFSSTPRVKDSDFSDGNTSTPIDITVNFFDLTPNERIEFQSNLLDGELIVTRQFVSGNSSESGKYFVSARVNPEFTSCR